MYGVFYHENVFQKLKNVVLYLYIYTYMLRSNDTEQFQAQLLILF